MTIRQQNHLFEVIDSLHLRGARDVFAALLAPVGNEIDERDHRMLRFCISQKTQLLADLCFFIFAQGNPPIGLARSFPYGGVIARQRREGGKLRRAIEHGHWRMLPGDVMRKVQDVLVASHALCPPICRFRSFAVAPSIRLVPFKMAFLPNFFLISRIACWPCLSRASCSSSALRWRSSAS